MKELVGMAASGNHRLNRSNIFLLSVYTTAFALCGLLTTVTVANAAVVSYSGPTYGIAYYAPCSYCVVIDPLPNYGGVNSSVISPAAPSGITVQIKQHASASYSYDSKSYLGEIYTFTVDEPIYFNAFLGTTLEYTGNTESWAGGASAKWSLCAGAGGQTVCANPISGWQQYTSGNGTFSQTGPYIQLAPGTYSVWAELSSSINNQTEQNGVPTMISDATFNVNVSLSSVPIPAAVWLFGSGLVVLGWIRRKRNT